MTLMHEHVCVLSDGVVQAFPRLFDREAAVGAAVDRLQGAAALGIGTIVDLTVLGQGRDIGIIADVAERVDVNIVVATGAYTFDRLPRYFQTRSIDHLSDQFVADIEHGIAGTTIKAGVIKCSSDVDGVTADIDKLLRAAARASLATGTLISTHTHAPSRSGIDQLRIFEEEGVDPTRVVIGHCGDTVDLEYLEQLLDHGAYLGMDRFGIDRILPMDARIETVVELCRRGHADRLVLSHDCCCHIDWVPSDSPLLIGLSMDHVIRRVVPALTDGGVTSQAITQMLVDNPRRAVGSSRVDLQACKLEYSIVSPK